MNTPAGPSPAGEDAPPLPTRPGLPVFALTLFFLFGYGALAAAWTWIEAPAAARDLRWLGVTTILAAGLALLSAIDLKTYRLPDPLTLPLAACGLALSLVFADGAVLWRGASAIFAFAFMAGIAYLYERVRKRAGLGLGDAKLFAAAGAWLGLEHLAAMLLAASLTALAFVAVKALWTGTFDPAMRLAFGPFLAGGFWLVWLAIA